MSLFQPLTPTSDQDRISPYHITIISSRQVMRIKKNINGGKLRWHPNQGEWWYSRSLHATESEIKSGCCVTNCLSRLLLLKRKAMKYKCHGLGVLRSLEIPSLKGGEVRKLSKNDWNFDSSSNPFLKSFGPPRHR